MKKIQNIVLYIFLLITSQELYSAILTVNNSNPSPGQYTDLQTAIDAAVAGDTLLIHRSSTSYGNAVVTKRLVIIGEGAMPNKAPLSTSTLGTVTLTYNTTTLEHASKTKLIGLLIGNLNVYEKNATLTNSVDTVEVSYCKINTMTLKNNVYGLKINNSIINNLTNGNLYGSEIKQNMFFSLSASSSAGSNNLVIGNIFAVRLVLNGGVVANNIVYNNTTFATDVSCKNVIYSNNLFYASSSTISTSGFSLNGNTSINNLFNVDPLFVSPITFTALFAYTHTVPASGPFADFHLQAGSPAKNAGTDGTDLGVYNGPKPWRDGSSTDSRYRYFPLPNAIPVITGMTINNPVVNSGGTLQIQLNATTQP
ncbi:MAG: hypothetical protein J0G96_05520 [Flavobacteriia bacterium]|nr:hypothetical protein [Flavobacteriia bacterium]OJX36912.1 MAG: hypothetical protein BGO87_14100 [Flavobacteriia bacterium 40-80]